MHLQCTMSSIFDWEVRLLCMRDKLKHGTIRSPDLDIFTKIAVFFGEKMFQRQIQEVQYTKPIRRMTNISDLVWHVINDIDEDISAVV